MDAPIPQPEKTFTLSQAKAELLRQNDAEIMERENALIDLRGENFSMLHEDEPAAAWIKYVPIGSVILEVIILIKVLFIK